MNLVNVLYCLELAFPNATIYEKHIERNVLIPRAF